jgi:hypothetical protein
MKRRFIILVGLIFSLSQFSCSILKQIENISRLKFKLDRVGDFTLMGVNISNKSSVRDFTVFDAAQFLNGITRGTLPVSFNLYIDALNPNDGGGYTKQDLDIVDFKWRLFIDDKETINGNISNPISVPGRGEATVFPITIKLDLYKFFHDRGYDGLVDLALKLGGLGGNAHRVRLKAKPTLKSIFGNITYPGEIEIIDREFR